MASESNVLNVPIQINGDDSSNPTTPTADNLLVRELYIAADGSLYAKLPGGTVKKVKASFAEEAGKAEILESSDIPQIKNKLKLVNGTLYGTALPSTGVEGQIFFLIS